MFFPHSSSLWETLWKFYVCVGFIILDMFLFTNEKKRCLRTVTCSHVKYITVFVAGNVSVLVFGRENFLGKLDGVAAMAREALESLQEKFDLAFPLPQLNLVALPHFGRRSPADQWGLVLFQSVHTYSLDLYCCIHVLPVISRINILC